MRTTLTLDPTRLNQLLDELEVDGFMAKQVPRL